MEFAELRDVRHLFFYLRGVAPPEVATSQIYKGVIPFVTIQLLALLLIALWPELATWLPGRF